MAGEWIKLSTNIHTKPEVFKLARALDISVDEVVGYLVRFWCWVDLVTVDGVVDGVETRDVDAVVRRDGFCDALIAVGWAQSLDSKPGIAIPNFDRHNGESAKKRALKNERQARWRAGKVDGAVDKTASTQASTREEKRREEKRERAQPSQKASRLPKDWTLTTEQIEWAIGAHPGWKPEDVLRVAEVFRDYWTSAPGQQGVKQDWDATWRNWVRREHQKHPERKPANPFAGAI